MKYLSLSFLIAVGSCGSAGPTAYNCAGTGEPRGVAFVLQDSLKGSVIPLYDVRAAIRESDGSGAFGDSLSIDSITHVEDLQLPWLSLGYAGVFTGSISVRGYRPWNQAGIVVKTAGCTVIPVVVPVKLQPVN